TDSLSTFLFVALPLYILAGEIMNRGGITNRLINLAKVFVGFLRGGLAHVNVFVSMLFGGIQGMAAADTAAIGSVMIPAMKKEGYDPDFSAAITISSSVIGAVIPPRFLFILFGATVGVPVADIFSAA